MAVRTIFKVLIGTIVAIVISALFIEILNIALVGNQINMLSKMAFKQAAVFFSQETYKREDAKSINMPDIMGITGALAVSGKFYDKDTPEDIYDSLYLSNTDFRMWASNHHGIWENLEYLKVYLGIPSSLSLTYDNYIQGEFYANNRMTPLNLGITYLDKQTIERIARWNLASIFANGQDTMIINNDGPDVYVKYKGFRVYVNNARITNIEYKVLNVINDKYEFESLTNLDTSKLGIDSATDERANVCIAGIEYSVPIAYEGVTPLKQIMEFIWNTRVEGLNNSASTPGGTYTIVESDLTAGGIDGNNNLPVPSRLIFYVMK